jgi:PmbA protein
MAAAVQVADLQELCLAAVRAAEDGEQAEAYAEESTRTQVKARGAEIESMSSAETRGVGVRVIVGGRLGYAYAADPSSDEVVAAVAKARANAALSTPDEGNALPDAKAAKPLPQVFRASQAGVSTERKVTLALELERATVRSHPKVRKVEQAMYGDSVSRIAIASTAGPAQEYARTDCWCASSALAEDGDETQTGFGFRLGREIDELEWMACAHEAATRAARLLGSRKPATKRVPVVLDPNAAVSFLGVLAGPLSAESVQKGRSLFAGRMGEVVGAEAVTLIDDGRFLDGPAAAPFDDEGVPTQRTSLIERGRLAAFLHSTYTARRGRTLSTGNAGRGSYRTAPGVSPSNLYLVPGQAAPKELLRRAEGGVYIQDVSGVHSGANPISGEFSVGATGLRISGGELGEPLREMTIASTLPDMLRAVVALGSDLRFFGSIGAPSVLVGEVTVAGT